MTVQEWLLEAKTEPIVGDFLVERNHGLLSDLIAWRQGGTWSHVSIPVSTFSKIETHVRGGFQASLLNFSHGWAYMRLKHDYQSCIHAQKWKERIAWHTQRKTRYDFRGIRAAFWNHLGRDDKDSFYCSELLDDLLTFSSPLQITSGWPWPQRCFESQLYDCIGTSYLIDFHRKPIDKNLILNLIQNGL